MLEQVIGEEIARHARCEEIPRLAAAWDLAAGGGVADFALFNPQSLAPFADNLMVIEPTDDGDFRYLSVGAGVLRHSSVNLVGGLTSQLGGEAGKVLIDVYRKALSAGRPLLAHHRALRSATAARWERLVCPVRDSAGAMRLVVFSKPIAFRGELLETIFDAAPMGFMAFDPVRDAGGVMVDARLVTINRHAQQLVGPGGAAVGSSIFDLFPSLEPRGIWTRYRQVVETRQTAQFDAQRNADPQGPWYRVTIAPWTDGFIVMFTDITELKQAFARLRHETVQLWLEVGAEKATRDALSAELVTAAAREEELRQAIEADALTGILNRRGFERAFQRLIAERGGGDGQIYLGLVDIDRFKSVNDTWGHGAGDEVLKSFASRLGDAIGGFDASAGRVGGEEFAICMWASAEMDTQSIFRSLQGAVTADAFSLGNGLAIALTCSVGYASLSTHTGPADCFRRADAALYEAKRFGRNLVRLGEAA